MSRVLIDTNAYSEMMAGDARVARYLSDSDAVLLSPIVVGELYDGFLNGSRYHENRQILQRFRAKPRTTWVPITDDTARWFADTKRGLRKRGTSIPINDVWIAASCMEHGAGLISFDSHCERIDGLRLCRPVLFDESHAALREIMRFQHFKRYHLEFEYDWDKLQFLCSAPAGSSG